MKRAPCTSNLTNQTQLGPPGIEPTSLCEGLSSEINVLNKETGIKEVVERCLNCKHFKYRPGRGLTCTARRCPKPKVREWLKSKGVRWKF